MIARNKSAYTTVWSKVNGHTSRKARSSKCTRHMKQSTSTHTEDLIRLRGNAHTEPTPKSNKTANHDVHSRPAETLSNHHTHGTPASAAAAAAAVVPRRAALRRSLSTRFSASVIFLYCSMHCRRTASGSMLSCVHLLQLCVRSWQW